jgi:hypothetical protein
MPLPPPPPTELVLPTLQNFILPALGGAAVVASAFALFGRRAGALGSAVAVVVAFAWGNYDFSKLDWEGTWRIMPWKPDDPARAWQWFPRAALVLVLVGLLSRWLGMLAGHLLTKPVENYWNPEAPQERVGRYWWGANLLTWAPRIAAVAVVSGWVISERVNTETPWLRLVVAAAILLSWVALDGVARGGAGGQVAAYQGAMLLAAGAVMLYEGWVQFAFIVLGFAMLGVALVCGAARTDASGAVPVGAAMIPGLVLVGRQSVDEHPVPVECFWLVALAPLVLLPFLVPAINRLPRWAVIPLRALLVLAPLVVAVFIANKHVPLEYP